MAQATVGNDVGQVVHREVLEILGLWRVGGRAAPWAGAGASAIQYNLSIVDTVGNGYLQVSPGDATTVTSSSINWTASGQVLNNGLVVKLDGSRQVKVFAMFGATNFIIDVLGYYL